MLKEVRATNEGHSELSSNENNEQENEPHAVTLTSQQVIDHIEVVKEYFQQQQDDCSVQMLQPTEIQCKVIAPSLKVCRVFSS